MALVAAILLAGFVTFGRPERFHNVAHSSECFLLQVGDSEKELGGAEGQNPYSTMVDEANGLDKIEELQNHSNREIYEKAVNILETFFDVEDGEVENLAPSIDANQVAFSAIGSLGSFLHEVNESSGIHAWCTWFKSDLNDVDIHRVCL